MGVQFLGNQTGGCGYTGLARLISGGVLRLMRLDFLSLARAVRKKHVECAGKLAASMGSAPAGSDGLMHPNRLLAALREALPRDAVVVADGGDFLSFARVGLPASTYLDPGLLGCIGVGTPFGIAASLAFPDRTVAVVTRLQFADHAAMARAFGLHAERVERAEGLSAAIERALANRPALLDVLVTPEAVSSDAKNVAAHPHRPEVLVLRLFDLVKAQARGGCIHLQVKGCGLGGLLLVASQPREAVGEGVGDAEQHGHSRAISAIACFDQLLAKSDALSQRRHREVRWRRLELLRFPLKSVALALMRSQRSKVERHRHESQVVSALDAHRVHEI